jgi:hypothetical protein
MTVKIGRWRKCSFPNAKSRLYRAINGFQHERGVGKPLSRRQKLEKCNMPYHLSRKSLSRKNTSIRVIECGSSKIPELSRGPGLSYSSLALTRTGVAPERGGFCGVQSQCGVRRSRISPPRCILWQLNYPVSVQYPPTHGPMPTVRLET